MLTSFNKLPIGAKFHTGKSHGSGCFRHEICWEEFRKDTPSTATCTAQVNFHNGGRGIGHPSRFAPNAIVSPIQDEPTA